MSRVTIPADKTREALAAIKKYADENRRNRAMLACNPPMLEVAWHISAMAEAALAAPDEGRAPTCPRCKSVMFWVETMSAWLCGGTCVRAAPASPEPRPACDFGEGPGASLTATQPERLVDRWPLDVVLERLADAADHLRGAHNCDAHGHEGVLYAAQAAREHVRRLRAASPEPEGERCTGLSAKWCPVHGDCKCEEEEDRASYLCPLHSPTSSHGPASPPSPAPEAEKPCPVKSGNQTTPGSCFSCGATVEPSPCHCGAMHTGAYCWTCHHMNVGPDRCAAPFCPEHGFPATERWLKERAPAPSSPAKEEP